MTAPIEPEDGPAESAPKRRYPPVDPLTISQVMEITGRSKRTIERWTSQGILTPYEVAHPREIVYLEAEVLDVEHEKTRAKRQGRPRPEGAK